MQDVFEVAELSDENEAFLVADHLAYAVENFGVGVGNRNEEPVLWKDLLYKSDRRGERNALVRHVAMSDS